MKVTKALSTAGFGAAVVVGSMLAVNFASAQSATSEQQAERVSELAERFNLDETEVQSFYEEKKVERQAEREEARAEHIAGLVEAGTLTQAQADELNALKDEAKAAAEALRESGAEREEMKAQMEASRAAVEEWADAQGINLDDIRSEKGEGRGHGQGGPRSGHGQNDDSSESTTEES